eukprot:g12281.t1
MLYSADDPYGTRAERDFLSTTAVGVGSGLNANEQPSSSLKFLKRERDTSTSPRGSHQPAMIVPSILGGGRGCQTPGSVVGGSVGGSVNSRGPLVESPRIASPIDRVATQRILELKDEELIQKNKEITNLHKKISFLKEENDAKSKNLLEKELRLSKLEGDNHPNTMRLTRHFPQNIFTENGSSSSTTCSGVSRLPDPAEVIASAANHLRFKEPEKDGEVLEKVAQWYVKGLEKVRRGEWKRVLRICEHIQKNLASEYAASNWTVCVGWYSYSVSNADKYLLIDCDTTMGLEFPRILIMRSSGDVVLPK